MNLTVECVPEIEEPGGHRAPSLDAVLQPLSRVVLVLHRGKDDEEQQEFHQKLVHVGFR